MSLDSFRFQQVSLDSISDWILLVGIVALIAQWASLWKCVMPSLLGHDAFSCKGHCRTFHPQVFSCFDVVLMLPCRISYFLFFCFWCISPHSKPIEFNQILIVGFGRILLVANVAKLRSRRMRLFNMLQMISAQSSNIIGQKVRKCLHLNLLAIS